ncbi:DUF4136 domain-containing protein [Niastella populi]|uniref:DUF4136 domain-containing protein n=1 Tax=Niastella populi TaxID=550983 RepID=A0A1V9FBQ2_9BACT|nr:DUF4136 domain-containing protein [Niastella populi]OQP55795.1 hypothetical protein A4R26_27230 [Niastella populi]
MKKITTLCVIGLSFFVSCGPSNTREIGKNIDADVTNLADVKTYGWITDVDKIPEARVFVSPTGVYVYNNESARKRIKDAIEYELNTRGYKMKSVGDPGMTVSFFITEQADTLRRTSGYVTIGGEAVVSNDDVEWVPVQPGTLIINLNDNKTQKMVWQGFASGIIAQENINNEQKIREAVSSIFDQFNYEAKGK